MVNSLLTGMFFIRTFPVLAIASIVITTNARPKHRHHPPRKGRVTSDNFPLPLDKGTHGTLSPLPGRTATVDYLPAGVAESYPNGIMTFYGGAGQGACGADFIFTEQDFTVALSGETFMKFGNLTNDGQGHANPACGHKVRVTKDRKTADATISNECPECPPEHLDMSTGLFAHLADKSLGKTNCSWEFI